MENPHRWPTHPAQSLIELLAAVAASLTASVQPFEHHPRELVSEVVTHRPVVGDGVIAEVASQFKLV